MIIIYDSTVVLTRNLFKVVNYDCRTIQDWPIWSIINYHHHNFIAIFVVVAVAVDFSLRTQKKDFGENQIKKILDRKMFIRLATDIRSPSLILYRVRGCRAGGFRNNQFYALINCRDEAVRPDFRHFGKFNSIWATFKSFIYYLAKL